jgi:hypothetical protein
MDDGAGCDAGTAGQGAVITDAVKANREPKTVRPTALASLYVASQSEVRHCRPYSKPGAKPWHSAARGVTQRILSRTFERVAANCSPQGSGFESLSRSHLAIGRRPQILRCRHRRIPQIAHRRDACRATQEGFELLVRARSLIKGRWFESSATQRGRLWPAEVRMTAFICVRASSEGDQLAPSRLGP